MSNITIKDALSATMRATKNYVDKTIASNISDLVDTSTMITELNKKANNTDLSTVATSGSYNDLTNKPSIPTTYAGSSSAGGAATSANKVNQSIKIQLNGGTTEGTNQFTFDGSGAKTINITAASINAAASSHGTHVTLEGTGSATTVSRSDHNHDTIYAPINSPSFTSSISLGRLANSTIGNNSVALGISVTAAQSCSYAEGYYTIASSSYQHVQGKYNVSDASNTYAHIVGNGTSTSARSNAHTLDWDGNAWFAGKISVGVSPTNNMDVATKQYVDSKVGGAKIQSMTLAQYNSLSQKDSNTLYIITG